MNGREQAIDGAVERGYVRLRRTWSNGDVVTLTLPMPVERVRAHPDVQDDAGCIALQRGPIVYCMESADNDVPLHRVLLPDEGPVDATYVPGLLGGITVLRCAAWAEQSDAGAPLYDADPPGGRRISVTAIPYYAWDNRAAGRDARLAASGGRMAARRISAARRAALR